MECGSRTGSVQSLLRGGVILVAVANAGCS